MVWQARVILITTLLAGALLGCRSQSNEAAHALLEAYMENATGFAGAPAMTTALDDQESKLASLKGQLPQAFHDRYQRLIDITRLTIAPTIDGPSRQQIAEYVQSVTGTPPPEGANNLTISAAFAFSEEVLRLDMLLDGETDRDKVREKYAEIIRAKQNAR